MNLKQGPQSDVDGSLNAIECLAFRCLWCWQTCDLSCTSIVLYLPERGHLLEDVCNAFPRPAAVIDVDVLKEDVVELGDRPCHEDQVHVLVLKILQRVRVLLFQVVFGHWW